MFPVVLNFLLKSLFPLPLISNKWEVCAYQDLIHKSFFFFLLNVNTSLIQQDGLLMILSCY